MVSAKYGRRLFALFLMGAMALTACAAQPAQVTEKTADFLFALPQIVVDVDAEGVPSVNGVTPEVLKAVTFGQVDTSLMRIPKETVDWLTRTNVQHFEVVNKDDGLFLYANGKALPSIGWTAESFASIGDLATQSGFLNEQMSNILKMALPFVQRGGMDVIFKFPLQAGATAIPLADTTASQPASAVAAEAAVKALINVDYNRDGVPSITNLTSRDLARAVGYDLRMAELTPEAMTWLIDHRIQHMSMRSSAEGVQLWINDKPLPTLMWSDDTLKNTGDLYSQLFYIDENLRQTIITFLPELSKIDVAFVFHFPLADGAAAIPVPVK